MDPDNDVVDLGQFGAPGFSLETRVDFSGHKSGKSDPHVNTDILNPDGSVLGCHDLTHNQIPGMNGRQNG
jgi:hypothetical protein